ncbi:MAG: glutamyl-tRNA synthetase, partial [Actinomycetota bacterium]|nr:glutamyl-tRNA synthetase [Actinomycetota bacterium]
DEGPDKGGPHAPYHQMQRLPLYQQHAQILLDSGRGYYCWCTPQRLEEVRTEQQRLKQPPRYDRFCLGKTRDQRAAEPGFSEPPVVRLNVPDDVAIEFDDVIRGRIGAPRPNDPILLRSDGTPTYHLAVVVDDHFMEVSHVTRGEEWISSTPIHLALYAAFGWQPPQFAHFPLLRNPDGSKISKRKNPAARLLWFQEQGYLPEALVNFLGLMGYSMPDGREIFSFDDMVASFDWARVNTVGPVFDLDKLAWLNGHYVRELSPVELASRITDHLSRTGVLPPEPTQEQRDVVTSAVPLVQERMAVLSEAEGMLGFLFADETFAIDPAAAAAVLTGNAREVLTSALHALDALETWTTPVIEDALRGALIEELGLKPKHAFGPVRVAVTGRRVSPPLFESIELLGRERTLHRLRAGLDAVTDEGEKG